jgi:predicted lipoprotein with Yx(FWY)xxD motif
MSALPTSSNSRTGASRGSGFALPPMPGRTVIAIVIEVTATRSKGVHMLQKHRSGATGTATVRTSRLAAAVTLAALAALTILLLQPSSSRASQTSGPVVSTASSKLGRILVDPRGRTLYLFAKDTNGKSACVGQCATFWPPLIASGKPRAGTGAKATLLGTTRRADGRMQVTYNHHPLYTFVKDTNKGQQNGEGVSAFGAHWYVVSPAGAKIVKTTTQSGGGYSGGSGY